MATFPHSIRRGLPRTAGGKPWPVTGASAPAPSASAAAPEVEGTNLGAVQDGDATPASYAKGLPAATGLRQGLPRVAGGEPWPETGSSSAVPVPPMAVLPTALMHDPAPAAAEPVGVDPAPASQAAVISAPAVPVFVEPVPVLSPSPDLIPAVRVPAEPVLVTASSEPAAVTAGSEVAVPSLARRVRFGAVAALATIAGAAVIVLVARGVTTLPGVPVFLERYPGEYHLPEWSDPGFPAWARWTHFLNLFLMVLIIRTGLQVRRQQKPPAFWTPRRGGKKISLSLWHHTSLDLLWLANGVLFVVLLFASGHWVRIVPTSWEVFPNAASALLQYLTLDWPVENGWVNYNSLQQIMYFLVVFVAAPLAAVTGLRMSEWWPENAARLNRWYPAPLARAIHFPTMLFFVVFILVHVTLVFSTGALRNLNHMFAGTDVINWAGFWWFAGGLFLTAAAVWAARPVVLAPIASLFGRVSAR